MTVAGPSVVTLRTRISPVEGDRIPQAPAGEIALEGRAFDGTGVGTGTAFNGALVGWIGTVVAWAGTTGAVTGLGVTVGVVV